MVSFSIIERFLVTIYTLLWHVCMHVCMNACMYVPCVTYHIHMHTHACPASFCLRLSTALGPWWLSAWIPIELVSLYASSLRFSKTHGPWNIPHTLGYFWTGTWLFEFICYSIYSCIWREMENGLWFSIFTVNVNSQLVVLVLHLWKGAFHGTFWHFPSYSLCYFLACKILSISCWHPQLYKMSI